MKSDWKMSFFFLCKILEMFFNTSTADVQCSLFNRYNSRQPIPMQLSKKQNLLLNSLEHFLNLDQILNILKKDDVHRLCVSEITDCERCS